MADHSDEEEEDSFTTKTRPRLLNLLPERIKMLLHKTEK